MVGSSVPPKNFPVNRKWFSVEKLKIHTVYIQLTYAVYIQLIFYIYIIYTMDVIYIYMYNCAYVSHVIYIYIFIYIYIIYIMSLPFAVRKWKQSELAPDHSAC